MHSLPVLMQYVHGAWPLHLILRFWHGTQECPLVIFESVMLSIRRGTRLLPGIDLLLTVRCAVVRIEVAQSKLQWRLMGKVKMLGHSLS